MERAAESLELVAELGGAVERENVEPVVRPPCERPRQALYLREGARLSRVDVPHRRKKRQLALSDRM